MKTQLEHKQYLDVRNNGVVPTINQAEAGDKGEPMQEKQ